MGFENGRNSNFQGLVTLVGIPSCITHRPLPIYQISLKSKKLFVDGRTDVRTDIFPPLILLGRLLEVDLKITAYWLSSLLIWFPDWSRLLFCELVQLRLAMLGLCQSES